MSAVEIRFVYTGKQGRPARDQGPLRAWTRRRGSFTTLEAAEAWNCPRQMAGKYLRQMADDGLVTRTGKGHATRWHYVKPTAVPVKRHRETPVELTVVDRSTLGTPPLPAERTLGQTKEVRAMIALAQQHGAAVRRAKHGYLIVTEQGSANVPGTASDWRAMKNARANLRKIGVPA